MQALVDFLTRTWKWIFGVLATAVVLVVVVTLINGYFGYRTMQQIAAVGQSFSETQTTQNGMSTKIDDLGGEINALKDGQTALSTKVESMSNTLKTMSPTPTAVPPTAAPVPTNTLVPAPIATATQQPAVQIPDSDRIKRLVDLDKIYRNQGLQAWLHAAGFSWDGALQEARQVEEETIMYDGSPKIVVSGVQLRATNFHASWPSAFTTDQPFTLDTNNGRSHKPDSTNPSVIVTNGTVSGTLTAWSDVSNWSQLTPPPR